MWDGVEFDLFLNTLRPSFFDPIGDILSSQAFYLALPLVLGAVFYWCVDKRQGEFIGLSCVGSMVIAMVSKSCINIQRPYVEHPELLMGYDPADLHAEGPSCPSGHTAISVSTFGSTALVLGKHILSVILVILAVLMLFSRMYMGVHTPLDVIVSVMLALVFMAISKVILDYSYRDERNYNIVSAGLFVFFVAFIAVAMAFYGYPLDAAVYEGGFIIGFLLGRHLEHRFVGYEVGDIALKDAVVRVVLGFVVMAVLLALPVPFLGEHFGIGIGGFLAMLWMMVGYPYLIKRRLSKA